MDNPKILPTNEGLSVMSHNSRNYQVYYRRKNFRTPDMAIQFEKDQWRIVLDEDLMMSVVRGLGTYGYSQGLFEIAFLDMENDGFSKIFENEWLDSVLGYLTETEVLEWLDKAEARQSERK